MNMIEDYEMLSPEEFLDKYDGHERYENLSELEK